MSCVKIHGNEKHEKTLSLRPLQYYPHNLRYLASLLEQLLKQAGDCVNRINPLV